MSNGTDDRPPGKDAGGKRPEDSETLFQEIRTRWASGEEVNPEVYLEKYPELEGELRAFFERMGQGAVVKGGGADKPGAFGEDGSSYASPSCPRLMGDFKVLREIGAGAMATVYEAEQISLNRKVALKVLPAHMSFSDRAVQRFHREAEAGGRQHHPGIVAVHAVGEDGGFHYIAQELVEGGRTLADRLEELQKDRDLPIGYFREAARLIAEVADALQHAHDGGVIHRDVKPSNILLTPEGRPKVTDFGLARVEDAFALSRTGDFAGTPYYMSPEQAMSRRMGIDHRTDIYSLGVTLYEMLTLKRPFEGKTSHEIFKKIMYHEPRDPSRENPRVPRELGVISLKAMEKDPVRRYQTMGDFADDLRRFLAGEVILARPAGAATRMWKRVKRNPVVSGSALAAFLALISFVVVVPWIIAHKEKEKRLALEEAKDEVEAAYTFITKMLAAPQPGREGKDVKVVEVLGAAEKEIGEAFRDRPVIEATLRSVIGDTYHALGELDEAERQITRALEIFRTVLGPVDPKTLRTMNNLGVLYRDQGRYGDAESLHSEVLEAQQRALDETHPALLDTQRLLATIFELRGRFDESEALLLDVLEKQRRVLGREHQDTLATWNALGVLRWKQFKQAEAEPIFREILDIYRRRKGEKHPETVGAKRNLASVLAQLGKSEEAEELFRSVLALNRRDLGDEHPDTLDTMRNLATLLKSYKDDQEKVAEAESLYRHVLEIRLRDFSADHPGTLTCMEELANLRAQQNRFNEAEGLYRKALNGRRRVLGKTHIDTLRTLEQLTRLLVRQDRFEEALQLLEESLVAGSRIFSPDHRIQSELLAWYGDCLLKLERYGVAEAAVIQTYDDMRSRYGEKHDKTRKALKRIITMYDLWGKPEEVKKYQELMLSEKKVSR